MDRTRKQLFLGSGFTLDKNRHRALSGFAGLFRQPRHRSTAEHEVNLDTYREVVLQGNAHFHDIYKPATLDDLIHKRVRGHNHQILDNYVATHGDYVTTPSRHSVIAGGRGGLSQRQQLTIDRDPTDLTLEAFFQDLDLQVVLPTVPVGTDMKPKRAAKGGRRGPILTVAEQHQLFDHIETPAFQQASLRHVIGAPEIVRRGDTIPLKVANGNPIQGTYLTDSTGACRYNFRKDGYAGRAGIKGRGRGRRDARDPSLNQGVLEPSVGLRKRDPATGDWIDNPAIPGEWVAVSITLPLRKPCLVGQNAIMGRVSLPGRLCVYGKHMTKRERAQRDGQM